MSKSSSVPAIGIDLGTTNSCVAIYLNGRVEVLANDVGERTTPSYVGFKDDEILVGKIAKEHAYRNYTNTIFNVKRLIGKKFKDIKVQEAIKYWPFTVVDRNGNPEFKIKLPEREVFYCPEQISAIILDQLREVASQRVETPVTKAVITVPAYFNDSQRQATKDAGKLAGLEVLMLLNEPTAAAISYALDKTSTDCKQALVFDLGGGTFDVSIIKFENRRVIVKAIHGDSDLGGNDFNVNVLTYLVEDIQKRYKYTIQNSKRAMSRLLAACERIKQTLSYQTSDEIELDGLIEGKDYEVTLTRKKFEELNENLFQHTLDIVRNCIETASLKPSDIDNIVLVGGSTKIPRIQSLLREYFQGKVLTKAVNPDEAVAIGAAIQAANLTKNNSQEIEDFALEDVIPFSLGIEVTGGIMSSIIKRNTSIPATAKKSFTTSLNDQTEVGIKIFEGEKSFTYNNNLLGTFILKEIPPSPRGIPKIEVSFDIDNNGILNVTAIEKLSNKENNITILIDKGRLSTEELEKMIDDARKYRERIEQQRNKKAINKS